MKPNLDIESQKELTLIDYVRIFGILIFVSLACLCIVLLAHGAKRSATIPAQELIANVAAETTQSDPNIKPDALLYCSCFTVHPIFRRDAESAKQTGRKRRCDEQGRNS
jgi:hypothetical protein